MVERNRCGSFPGLDHAIGSLPSNSDIGIGHGKISHGGHRRRSDAENPSRFSVPAPQSREGGCWTISRPRWSIRQFGWTTCFENSKAPANLVNYPRPRTSCDAGCLARDRRFQFARTRRKKYCFDGEEQAGSKRSRSLADAVTADAWTTLTKKTREDTEQVEISVDEYPPSIVSDPFATDVGSNSEHNSIPNITA